MKTIIGSRLQSTRKNRVSGGFFDVGCIISFGQNSVEGHVCGAGPLGDRSLPRMPLGGSGRVLQLRITRKTPQTATAMATESWGRRRVPKTSTGSDFESLHRRTLVVLRARPLVNVRASWWGCEDSLNPTIPTRTRGTWLRDHARASAWGYGNTRTHRSGIHTSSRWLHRPGACAFWSGYEGSPIRRKPSRNRGTFSSVMSSE